MIFGTIIEKLSDDIGRLLCAIIKVSWNRKRAQAILACFSVVFKLISNFNTQTTIDII